MTTSNMTVVKLWMHKPDYAEPELLLNPNVNPDIQVGDVVEIFHTEEDYSRLLLQVQVKSLIESQQKDVISVARPIAAQFQLRMYKDVVVNVVDPKEVALDLVELMYKEQYFSRADMSRFRSNLASTCLYLNKKLKFSEMRAQVDEMWSGGNKVACGYVTEETRITFRSSTAQVNIFIQMSREMWEFDNYGDLYFEKAVGGFLVDLFKEWKDKKCNHDVTINLFSRTFYDATSIEEFPMHMRECVQKDHLNRFYEDFYRVVVQNERYDDWTSTIIQLKKLFIEYPDRLLNYHRLPGINVPRACNSTAAQGNFLEVLNMGLNVFEKWYLDRCIDRTGKLSIVITPGVGVFEVDMELANITKQRTIDCGNGSDLVCMGEQPLHAVPLFKFHNKSPSRRIEVDDDYNIPHWINYSFYTSKTQTEKMVSSKFVPRVKMPDVLPMPGKVAKMIYSDATRYAASEQPPNLRSDDDNFPFMDYDAYDAQVFKLPSTYGSSHNKKTGCVSPKRQTCTTVSTVSHHRVPRVRYNSDMYDLFVDRDVKHSSSKKHSITVPRKRTESEEYMSNSFGGVRQGKGQSIETITRQTMLRREGQSSAGGSVHDDPFPLRPVVGSAGSASDNSVTPLTRPRPHRALINPFAPARLHFKVTSNRRRWAHAFPTDPKGLAMQLHHQASGASLSDEQGDSHTSVPRKEVIQAAQLAVSLRKQRTSKSESSDVFLEHHRRSVSSKSETLPPSIQPDLLDTRFNCQVKPMLKNSDRKRPQVFRDHSSRRRRLSHSESSNGTPGDIYRGGKMVPATSGSTESGSLESLKDPSLGGTSLQTVDSCNSIVSVINAYESQGSAHRARSSSIGMSPSRSSSYQRELSNLGLPEEGHNWLWGTTGEQEWTPEITTGVDWRSMICPASLPITTDYFPDKRSLQIDYVMADYSLLPDDVYQDHWKSPIRAPLSCEQVYKEMVSQRIAQGFQIVLLPKKKSPSEVTNLSSSPYQGSSSLMRKRAKRHSTEHILSIGRIFHKLTLNGNTITVTRYWPRHPYPQKSMHYTYRFQVPDSESYDVSWTNFCNEKLESYNWNYVDHYLCSRGEEDFNLMESLKFWRTRLFLLPSNNPATKRIIESPERIYCDIYESRNTTEYQQLIDGFVRFIEILNKIRRFPTGRKITKVQPVGRRGSMVQSPSSHLEKGHSSDMTAKVKKVSEIINESPTPGSMSGSPSAGSASDSRKSNHSTPLTTPEAGSVSSQSVTPVAPTERRLCLTTESPLPEIIDAMLDPMEGLIFLQKTPGMAELPPHTFSSAEAAAWLRCMVGGIETSADANKLLQHMMEEQYICHASGNFSHPYVYGFYLYYIISSTNKDKELIESDPLLYPNDESYYTKKASFQYEWCEIAVQDVTIYDDMLNTFIQPVLPTKDADTSDVESSILAGSTTWHVDHNWISKATPYSGSEGSRRSGTPDLTLNLTRTTRSRASAVYKYVNVDVDSAQKSDRQEWGTARYHANYVPNAAFELEVQWLVATGAILCDLITSWARKAGSSGFHLIPVPGDPFALPFNMNSDPLRGPIFIPLTLDCLKEPDKELFDEFEPSTREERLLLFQESILKRFGFMVDKPHIPGYPDESQPQYVHCSGGMFVLIPENKTTTPRNLDGTHRKPIVGSYKDYIAWQRGRASSSSSPPPVEGDNQEPRIGFLWAWNYMLTRRWRSNITGDERFQDNTLADFQAFCSNRDNRLVNYWQTCWASTFTQEIEADAIPEPDTDIINDDS